MYTFSSYRNEKNNFSLRQQNPWQSTKCTRYIFRPIQLAFKIIPRHFSTCVHPFPFFSLDLFPHSENFWWNVPSFVPKIHHRPYRKNERNGESRFRLCVISFSIFPSAATTSEAETVKQWPNWVTSLKYIHYFSFPNHLSEFQLTWLNMLALLCTPWTFNARLESFLVAFSEYTGHTDGQIQKSFFQLFIYWYIYRI